jgi:hypothetical protein
MEKAELEQYQKLTKFQKDVADALINLGFKHKYFSIYELTNYATIEVDKFTRWSDVLKHMHAQGSQQKTFEIQRVLGLI